MPCPRHVFMLNATLELMGCRAAFVVRQRMGAELGGDKVGVGLEMEREGCEQHEEGRAGPRRAADGCAVPAGCAGELRIRGAHQAPHHR